VFSDQPGPVERRAKPITAENPIPRRTRHVQADYPIEAQNVDATSTMTVRVVLDESGRVAETRVVGITLRAKGNQIGMSFTRVTPENLERSMNATLRVSSGERFSAALFRDAIEAMAREATRAVNQWLYAAPADGPIAFDVNVPVGAPPPPPPPPPAPASPRTSARPSMPPPPPRPAPVERAQEVAPEASWQMSDGALRVGGTIKAPVKLRNVAPLYPPDAQANKVQGVVIIEARIEGDGTVSHARVLRSIPLLDDAAVDAVRQWEFTPTLLNGQPVPVIMTVTVNFTLQ
jgi:TonB family protein